MKKSIKSNKNGPRRLKMVINHHWHMFYKVTCYFWILGHSLDFLAKNKRFLANLAILGSFFDGFLPRKWPNLKKTKIPPTEFQRIIFTRFFFPFLLLLIIIVIKIKYSAWPIPFLNNHLYKQNTLYFLY